jgi:hypothetical protein
METVMSTFQVNGKMALVIILLSVMGFLYFIELMSQLIDYLKTHPSLRDYHPTNLGKILLAIFFSLVLLILIK